MVTTVKTTRQKGKPPQEVWTEEFVPSIKGLSSPEFQPFRVVFEKGRQEGFPQAVHIRPANREEHERMNNVLGYGQEKRRPFLRAVSAFCGQIGREYQVVLRDRGNIIEVVPVLHPDYNPGIIERGGWTISETQSQYTLTFKKDERGWAGREPFTGKLIKLFGFESEENEKTFLPGGLIIRPSQTRTFLIAKLPNQIGWIDEEGVMVFEEDEVNRWAIAPTRNFFNGKKISPYELMGIPEIGLIDLSDFERSVMADWSSFQVWMNTVFQAASGNPEAETARLNLWDLASWWKDYLLDHYLPQIKEMLLVGKRGSRKLARPAENLDYGWIQGARRLIDWSVTELKNFLRDNQEPIAAVKEVSIQPVAPLQISKPPLRQTAPKSDVDITPVRNGHTVLTGQTLAEKLGKIEINPEAGGHNSLTLESGLARFGIPKARVKLYNKHGVINAGQLLELHKSNRDSVKNWPMNKTVLDSDASLIKKALRNAKKGGNSR